MEHHAVVETFARELGDAFDMSGRKVGPQLDDDVAAFAIAGVQGERQRFVGHLFSPEHHDPFVSGERRNQVRGL
jgi:hypothetical protein